MTRLVTLNDLIQESKDGEWGKGEPFENSIKMKVIRGTDFAAVREGNLREVPIRFIAMRHAERKKLRPHDILIETAGGSKNRPTGRTVFLTESKFNEELPLICASFARFIRIDQEKANSEYIFWLLQHLYNTEILRKYHTQHTGVARFQWTVFKENEQLSLPEISVQKQIASVLGLFDNLVEINYECIRVLEEISRLIYDEWFISFRYPGHENDEIIDTENGPIPKGWKFVTLDILADEIRDSVHPSKMDRSIPYVGLAHIPKKSIALSNWGSAGETVSTKLKFLKYDILFAKIRPYLHKVAIAPMEGISSSDTIIIRPKNEIDYNLILSTVSSELFVSYADKTSKGTQMPRTDWSILQKYQILYPSEELLKSYNKIMNCIIEIIPSYIFQNKTLIKIRDLLLQKLIYNEIDVSNLKTVGCD